MVLLSAGCGLCKPNLSRCLGVVKTRFHCESEYKSLGNVNIPNNGFVPQGRQSKDITPTIRVEVAVVRVKEERPVHVLRWRSFKIRPQHTHFPVPSSDMHAHDRILNFPHCFQNISAVQTYSETARDPMNGTMQRKSAEEAWCRESLQF
jgi:hypothetical protein